MKKLFILFFMVFAVSACSQGNKNIPESLQSKFKTLYPKADEVEWSKEEGNYEVNFELDDVEMSVVLDSKGSLLETETEIDTDNLPDVIKSSIEKDFAGYNIKEASKIVKDSKTTYEAELEKDGEKSDAIFDTNGKFIEEVEEKDEQNNYENNDKMENEQNGNEKGENEQNEKENGENENVWIKDFNVQPKDLSTVGKNKYFILKPGYQLMLSSKENSDEVLLKITVTNETKNIDGYETRVVEERDSKNGSLVEVSRNYFAIDRIKNDVYYFGEDVDIYKNGNVVNHEGAWQSGKDDAKFGLMIPGEIKVGEKYYQEVAPEVAMDRVENITDNLSFETSAGKFENCLKTEETTPLEPGVKEYKIYAPNVGLVQDGNLKLIKYEFINK